MSVKRHWQGAISPRVMSQLSKALDLTAVPFSALDHRASAELFRRPVDECFSSLLTLWDHCHKLKQRSWVHYDLAADLSPDIEKGLLTLGDGCSLKLNGWSFSQLCRLASVGVTGMDPRSPRSSDALLRQRLRGLTEAVEILVASDTIRSIRDELHERVWDADVLTMVREFATDFRPPPRGFNGATGLYAGEQDLFCFLMDPLGWAEINGQAFAPGFFVWNSEVGARPAGVSTFWFQAVCQNHIIWHATETQEFVCDKLVRADEAVREIRRHIEMLVDKRDQRRDGFAKLISQAMETRLGSNPQEVERILERMSVDRELASRAVQTAGRAGRFTIFSVLDALTRTNRELPNAAERTEADRQAAQLLSLVGEHRPFRRAANAISRSDPVLCPC